LSKNGLGREGNCKRIMTSQPPRLDIPSSICYPPDQRKELLSFRYMVFLVTFFNQQYLSWMRNKNAVSFPYGSNNRLPYSKSSVTPATALRTVAEWTHLLSNSINVGAFQIVNFLSLLSQFFCANDMTITSSRLLWPAAIVTFICLWSLFILVVRFPNPKYIIRII
jgi:hypothetical protein